MKSQWFHAAPVAMAAVNPEDVSSTTARRSGDQFFMVPKAIVWALFLKLVMLAGAGFYWGSTVNEKIALAEQRLGRIERTQETRGKDTIDLKVITARLDAIINQIERGRVHGTQQIADVVRRMTELEASLRQKREEP